MSTTGITPYAAEGEAVSNFQHLKLEGLQIMVRIPTEQCYTWSQISTVCSGRTKGRCQTRSRVQNFCSRESTRRLEGGSASHRKGKAVRARSWPVTFIQYHGLTHDCTVPSTRWFKYDRDKL